MTITIHDPAAVATNGVTDCPPVHFETGQRIVTGDRPT